MLIIKVLQCCLMSRNLSRYNQFLPFACGLNRVKSEAGMHYNGPAVCFSRRNPTTAPGRVLVPRGSGATKLSRCKEGLARVFAVMVQILLSSGAVAVQSLIGAAYLSPVTKLVAGTGAVSRYKADRSQKTVKV